MAVPVGRFRYRLPVGDGSVNPATSGTKDEHEHPMSIDPMSPDGTQDAFSFSYAAEADHEPVLTVVEAVSWVTGVDARAMAPLNSAVDVELLSRVGNSDDRMFYRSSSAADSADPQVSFRYEGCLVTVTPELVRIEPPAESR